MKVLVTGGAGMIGSHIVDALVARGDEVTLIDSLEPETHAGAPAWINPGARCVFGDIRHRDALDRAIYGADAVVHQAAFGGFVPEPRRTCDINLCGTAEVIEAARAAGVRTIVYASSQAVYGAGKARCGDHGIQPATRDPRRLRAGEWRVLCRVCSEPCHPVPVSEADDPAPLTAYAVSKYAAERLLLGAAGGYLRVAALRYSLIYGPRQSRLNPYTGICSIFAGKVRNGEAPVVFEDGLQLRELTYVSDVVAANLQALDDERISGVFNVGSGHRATVLDVARRLGERGNVAPVMSGLYRPDDARDVLTDSTKLRALGWAPRVDIKQGIDLFADWHWSCPQTPSDGWHPLERLMVADVVRRVAE